MAGRAAKNNVNQIAIATPQCLRKARSEWQYGIDPASILGANKEAATITRAIRIVRTRWVGRVTERAKGEASRYCREPATELHGASRAAGPLLQDIGDSFVRNLALLDPAIALLINGYPRRNLIVAGTIVGC